MILLTLLLGTRSITLPFIGDDVLSFRDGYCSIHTFSSIDYHPTLKNGVGTFRIIYAGGVCAYSANPVALYSQRLTKVHRQCRLFTEIDERQRKYLVQRTIDTTAKNCNSNYSGCSRHGLWASGQYIMVSRTG